jgi:NAD(P)-dependent dehydrogenase (short-subunit alcohol dehydrogenase family)
MKLTGKVALITGGGRGLGRAIALAYVREGAQVALADIAIDAAREAAEAIGPSAIAVEMDVTRQESIEAAVAETAKRLGRIDILINNVGNREVSVFKASGKGFLYSYVIHHRPVPGFTPPYSIAVVELEEGPRMMTNIVDCPQTPEALQLDMPVEVIFQKLTDQIALPLFRPAKG